MSDSLPTWTPFQPDAPPELPGEPGRVVAIVASPDVARAGWDADAAVRLARGWGATGHKVVLFDGGVAEPTLHEVLGMDNTEGLTDAVVFGASVGRVARRVPGQPLFFVSAGTAVGDPRATFEHPRWNGMCKGFLQAGATLLVFLRSTEEAVEPAVRYANDVVVLTGEDEDLQWLPGVASEKVRAVTGPDRDVLESSAAGVDDSSDVPDSLPIVPPPEAGEDSASEPLLDEPPVAGGSVLEEPAQDEGFGLEEDALADEKAGWDVPDLEAEAGEDLVSPAGDEDEDFEGGIVFGGALAEFDAGAEEAAEGDALEGLDFTPDEPEFDAGEGAAAPEMSGTDLDDGLVDPLSTLPEGGDPVFDAGPAVEPAHESRAPSEVDLAAAEGLADPLAAGPREEARPPVPTAEEILAEAGEAPPGAGPTPERVAAALDRSEERGSARAVRLVVLLVVLLAVAAGAWWYGLLEIPGLPSPGASSAAAGVSAAQAAAPAVRPAGERSDAGPAVPSAPAATYSVALEAHRDGATARTRMEELRGEAAGYLWIVAPVEVEGAVFHRVMVGPAASEAAAAALAEAVAAGTGRDAGEWVVRETRLAFLIDTLPTGDAAEARAAELWAVGVPAYHLRVAYSDGTARFRVYAGAYADAAEASYLQGVLAEQGLDAPLSERIGSLP